MRRRPPVLLASLAAILLAATAVACGGDRSELTIYSGRTRELVEPLLERFAEETGIDIAVRYGDTAELAATILEEGDRSPADVFYALDVGALGALAKEGRLRRLPADVLRKVPRAFRSREGMWVGTSGRSRILAYNPELVDRDELPDSVLDLTDPRWKGRLGWVPRYASFQAFVTALRVLRGERTAREWLAGMKANDLEDYPANIPLVQAVGEGEVAAGLTNHYYVPRLKAEDPGLEVEIHFFRGGDPGALVDVAAVGVLDTGDRTDEALRLVRFLLSPRAQAYFAEETFEYPLVEGVAADPSLRPLADLEPPAIDLSDLDDLRGTLDLLEDVGVL